MRRVVGFAILTLALSIFASTAMAQRSATAAQAAITPTPYTNALNSLPPKEKEEFLKMATEALEAQKKSMEVQVAEPIIKEAHGSIIPQY